MAEARCPFQRFPRAFFGEQLAAQGAGEHIARSEGRQRQTLLLQEDLLPAQ